jgi:pimeloyl-ACP methyl ester carboxylesterase
MGHYLREIGGDRVLAINEIGEATGFPLVVNHGMIASIREDRLFEGLVGSGFRVISIARPGYGLSSPFEMESIGEWGDVIGEIAGGMRLERFDVLGLSSGAPYSYAMARAMPGKVRNLYIFSGTPALCDERVRQLWPYPTNAKATMEDLRETARGLFFKDGVDPKNRAAADSSRNGCFGIALDLMLRERDWGFALGDIQTEVYMEHGVDDPSVPFATATITAGLLPHCTLDRRESGGHFSRELLDDFIKRRIAGHARAD